MLSKLLINPVSYHMDDADQNESGISERLVHFRNTIKCTVSDLASHINEDAGLISSVEDGSAGPTFELLIKLANSFDLSLDWLLTGDEPMFLKGKKADEIQVEQHNAELLKNVFSMPEKKSEIVRRMEEISSSGSE